MATLVTDHAGAERHRGPWTPDIALKYAWATWLALMAIPFLYFIFVMWRMVDRAQSLSDAPMARDWFIGVVAYMVLVVPGAIFLRSRIFRGYWKGQCVSPRAYYSGMLVVWVAIVLGGLASLVGCQVTRTMLPNLFTALAAFMIFLTMWPSGRAMVCTNTGDLDDPEQYEEPR